MGAARTCSEKERPLVTSMSRKPMQTPQTAPGQPSLAAVCLAMATTKTKIWKA